DWDAFLQTNSIKRFSALSKGFYDRQIHKAKQALATEDVSYFAENLPLGQTWRLYNTFREDAVFLDIETSGYYGDITVIGVYDGHDTKTMVRGHNLDKDLLRKTLAPYKLVITFNGASFDLPVIKRYFGNIVPEVPHIDLRHVCSKVGLTGGLKQIEKTLGIQRAKGVEGINGEDAVYLWQQYKATGKREYLETLVMYNEEDIVNLLPIADKVISQLWEKMRKRTS
ncbi:ribonuclease H-like domain-containing protein, partial [Candidatus Woesearchaeota archaeon]|nr:ribonuclease H-like domain-containing protein [Candidatus Woesearchaeota archaeon]